MSVSTEKVTVFHVYDSLPKCGSPLQSALISSGELIVRDLPVLEKDAKIDPFEHVTRRVE